VVPLKVAGVDQRGEAFQEDTATLDFSAKGCRYFSRYRVRTNSWVTLELPSPQPGSEPHRFQARIVWVRASRRLKGLFQVGTEVAAPVEVWESLSPQKPVPAAEASGTKLPEFEAEMKGLLDRAETGNYYQVLEVTALASKAQIKRNYYRLARKFHPDLYMDRAEWVGSLRKLMEALSLAYKTLSDEKLRQEYDKRLAQTGAFTLERSKTEERKSAEECFEIAKQCLQAKNYAGSILWLRKCVQAAPDSSRYHALLARSLAAVPQYRREAMEHFEKAIALDPTNVQACFQLAEVFIELKLPWRARALYEEVLAIDPANRKARELASALDSAEEEKDKKDPTLAGSPSGRKGK